MEATIVTFNKETYVDLKLGEKTKRFDGVYEAAAWCMENGVNLKHHINNQPAAIR